MSDDSRQNRTPSQDAALIWLIQEVTAAREDIAVMRSALDRAGVDVPASSEGTPAASPLLLQSDPTQPPETSKKMSATKVRQPIGPRLHAWWLRMLAAYLDRGKRTEWIPGKHWLVDGISIVALTTLALLLRVINITSIPPGMHGDEAATGVSARQILADGWIGVYSGIAGGNPTGDYYLAVPFIKWIHDPVLAVRLLSAIGGTLAVALLFLIVRRNVGYLSAVIATFLFAVSEWAIQFARIGMVTGNWLPFALLGTLCLLEAIRSQRWYWWIAAGVTLPSAIYIYNGHLPVLLLMLPIALIAILGWQAGIGALLLIPMLFWPGPLTIAAMILGLALVGLARPVRSWRPWISLAALGGAAFLVSRAMIRYAQNHNSDYFGRSRELSVFKTDDWKSQSGQVEQVGFLIKRYGLFWDRVTFHPIPNGADLSGVTPLIPTLVLLFCIAGLIVAVALRPSWLVLLSVAIAVGAPLSPMLTDLALRRALIVVPFGCILAGIGGAEVLRLAYAKRRAVGVGVSVALLAILLRIGQVNYNQFFDTTVNSQSIWFTFGTDYRSAVEFVDTLGPNDYVLFFSNNAPFRYDTGELIAGSIAGEDRSPEWGGAPGYDVDPAKGRAVFVLQGPHIDELAAIQAAHPGGTVVIGPTYTWGNGPAYVAYLLPEPAGT